MRHQELNLKIETTPFSATPRNPREHYKTLMLAGCGFPTTKAQAQFFVRNKVQFDVLNSADVSLIEYFLQKHGFEGDYKHTKSGAWVRLQNHSDFYAALKKEFTF